MEIHWRNMDEVEETQRDAVEQSFSRSPRGDTDLIDLRIAAKPNNHHRHGGQEVHITCLARGKDIVAIAYRRRPRSGAARRRRRLRGRGPQAPRRAPTTATSELDQASGGPAAGRSSRAVARRAARRRDGHDVGACASDRRRCSAGPAGVGAGLAARCSAGAGSRLRSRRRRGDRRRSGARHRCGACRNACARASRGAPAARRTGRTLRTPATHVAEFAGLFDRLAEVAAQVDRPALVRRRVVAERVETARVLAPQRLELSCERACVLFECAGCAGESRSGCPPSGPTPLPRAW